MDWKPHGSRGRTCIEQVHQLENRLLGKSNKLKTAAIPIDPANGVKIVEPHLLESRQDSLAAPSGARRQPRPCARDYIDPITYASK
jgi:hypothetical protein